VSLHVKCIKKVSIKRNIQSFGFLCAGAIHILRIKAYDRNPTYLFRQKSYTSGKKYI